MNKPTFDEVSARLALGGDGTLTWLATERVRPGSVAGCVSNSSKYRIVRLNRKSYLAHRLVWLLTHREWPVGLVDHINGVKDDNRIENLRLATYSQNSSNRAGVSGVTKHRGKYQAQIKHHGRSHYLGLHATEEEARQAYAVASAQLHGEFGARA